MSDDVPEPIDMDSDAGSDARPTFMDSVNAAAKRSGIASVTPGETPSGRALLSAMGGIRGLIESILPGLAFLIVFTVTGLLLPSVLVPLGISVIFVIARVIARQPFTSALAGVVGIGLSAGLALITGRAADNFVLGFVINGAFLVALLISIAVRWPLVGIVVSIATSEGGQWRADRAKFRVAVIATALWSGLFALRLAVELPLWFTGQAAALAALKLVLGVPVYAALLWVTWLLVRTVYARSQPE